MSGFENEQVAHTDPRREDLERGIQRVGEHFAQRAAREDTSELEQLRQQLLLAQAENQKLKSQWNAAQKATQAPPPNVQREVDLVQTTSQLKRAQRDLASERQARASEAEDFAQKIAAFEQQIANAGSGAGKSNDRRGQITWAGIAAAVVAAGFLISPHIPLAKSATPPVPVTSIETVIGAPERQLVGKASAPETGVPGAAGPAVQPDRAGPTGQTTQAPPTAKAEQPAASHGPSFMVALSRLNHALSAVPGRTPQQVLQQVQKAHGSGRDAVCSFEWKESGPALLFGNDHKGTDLTSLGNTLSRCADAVEKSQVR